jgi:hypothetical protein
MDRYDMAGTDRRPGGLRRERRLTIEEAAELREARLTLMRTGMETKPRAGALGAEARERQLAVLGAEQRLHELETAVRERRAVRFAGVAMHELRGHLATIEGREAPQFRLEDY